jgi:hypothetical protein
MALVFSGCKFTEFSNGTEATIDPEFSMIVPMLEAVISIPAAIPASTTSFLTLSLKRIRLLVDSWLSEPA